MKTADLIFEQAKTLPEPMAREVLDFIGYLKGKQEHTGLTDLMRAQQAPLAAIWDHEADEVWKDL